MNDTNLKNLVRAKIEDLLSELGFEQTNIQLMPGKLILAQDIDSKLAETSHYTRDGYCYKYNELYCGISFSKEPDMHGKVQDWVYIEYAESLDATKRNDFDDGEMIPLDIPVEQIITELREELLKNINSAR